VIDTLDILATGTLAIGALALMINAVLGLTWALRDAATSRSNALHTYARDAAQSFVVQGMLATLLHQIGAL
jgi:hypothetical protein